MPFGRIRWTNAAEQKRSADFLTKMKKEHPEHLAEIQNLLLCVEDTPVDSQGRYNAGAVLE